MILDLRELLNTPGSRKSFEIDHSFPDLEGLDMVSAVRGTLTAFNSREHIVVEGSVESVVGVECNRCLSRVELPVRAELEALGMLEYHDSGQWARINLREDEEAAAFFGETTLDIDEVVRQGVLLHLPLQVICKPDCRGICPGCGANLNAEPCHCPPEETDPRLSVLKDWFMNRDRGSHSATL